MRWTKLFLCVLGGFFALLVVAAGALWLGGSRAAIWAVEHPLSATIGRQIRIDGPLTFSWGAPSRIVVQDIQVANAGWGSQPEMFSAKRLEIDLFVRTLLFGPTRIPLIRLDGAKLLLETSQQNQGNWDFGLSSAAPQKRGQFPILQQFVLADSELTYRNGQTGAQTALGLAKLQLDAPDPAGQVKMAGDGSFQKRAYRFTGAVGSLAALRDASKPYPMKFDGTLEAIRVAIDGTIAEPLDFNGLDLRLSLAGKKLDDLASMLGVPLPELPDFKGTSQLTGGNGNWALKAVSVQLGKSDVAGGLAIDTNAKVPHIEANLTSSYMDLADFKGFYGGKPDTSTTPAKPPDPDGRVLPNTRIAIQKLPDLNADLKFDAARIKSAGGLPIDRVSLGLQLKDGAITIQPLRFHTAQGDIDLSLYFTPFTKSGPPSLKGRVDVRHIDLHQLLGGPTMPDMVKETGGVVGGFFKLDATGVSLREFLGNMNGDAGLFMENGQVSALLEQLAPIDVLGALGVYVRGDAPVQINCLVSRFDIKKGVATASTLLFDTDNATVVGGGNVNFADETLFLELKPYNKSFTTVSLRTPVEVRGTFAKPAFNVKAGTLIARLGAAVGIGVLFPPAALLPLIDTGLGDQNACSKAYATQSPPKGPGTPGGNSGP